MVAVRETKAYDGPGGCWTERATKRVEDWCFKQRYTVTHHRAPGPYLVPSHSLFIPNPGRWVTDLHFTEGKPRHRKVNLIVQGCKAGKSYSLPVNPVGLHPTASETAFPESHRLVVPSPVAGTDTRSIPSSSRRGNLGRRATTEQPDLLYSHWKISYSPSVLQGNC